MSDPIRLRDAAEVGSERVRALLRHAAPPPAMPEAVRLASADVVRELAKTPSRSGVSTPVVMKVVVSLVAVGALTAIVSTSMYEAHVEVTTSPKPVATAAPAQDQERAAPARTPEAQTSVPAPVSEAQEPTVRAEIVTPPLALQVQAPQPTRHTAVRAPTSNAPSPSNTPPTVDELAAEASLLEAARSALTSNPRAALARVDEHARRFATGQLVAERELIRIDALVRLGRSDQASSRARTFVTRFPAPMYRERVSRILGHDPNATNR